MTVQGLWWRGCGRTHAPLVTRFWRMVNKDGPLFRPALGRCWDWLGATSDSGYGVLGRGGRGAGLARATHVSWEIHNDPVPAGQWVLHKCDNPPCTRPEHLFLGGIRENVDDMVAKQRHAHGENCSYARLTDEDVIDIRSLFALGARNGVLAREFGVSRAMVRMIISRQRWAHLP